MTKKETTSSKKVKTSRKKEISVQKENKNNRFLVYISVIMLIIGIALLKNGLTSEEEQISTPYYSYKATKSSEYNVSLIPNTFYNETVLPSGKQYAAPVIDKYNFILKYNFTGSEKADIDYTYNITADLVGNVKNSTNENQEIWKKTFVLTSNKSNKKVNETNFQINEGVIIDYSYYNNLARLYEQTYGMLIDAYLNVKLNINGNIVLPNKKELNKMTDTIAVSIPLTNTVTEVETNYEPITSEEFLNVSTTTEEGSKMTYTVIGITLSILAILILVFTLTRRKVTAEAKYRKNVNKVLREYGDLIVTVTNKPDLRNLKSMRLAMLEDLVDAAEQNKSNIIHYEKTKDKESMLLVIAHGYVYMYSITADEFNGQN